MWQQFELILSAKSRGMHLITTDVLRAVPSLDEVRIGLLHVFLLHTSASLSVNENADPDVPRDLAAAIDHIVSEDFPYLHAAEGPDDMPAHVKSSLFGCSLTIPVREGHLALGTWQGIYLCEHRNRATRRRLILTLQGE